MKSSTAKTFAFIGIGMSVFFIVSALAISMGKVDHIDFIRENRMMVAIILLLYGLFRLYRSVMVLRHHKDDINR